MDRERRIQMMDEKYYNELAEISDILGKGATKKIQNNSLTYEDKMALKRMLRIVRNMLSRTSLE